MAKSQKTYDVTGFNKIHRRQSLNDENINKQRYAVVVMYQLLLNRNVSKEEAAKDCGYTSKTLDTWSRIFSK